MASIEFEIQEGQLALSGIAVIQTADEYGRPYVFFSLFGDPKPVELVGMLQTSLDQIRYTFIDKDISPEELFGRESSEASEADEEDEEE